MTAWDIVLWIVFGLVAGILAKWIFPGKNPGGFILTVILGIAGAFVGGYVATLLGAGIGDSLLGRLILAVAGAVLLLFIFNLAMKAMKK